MLTIVLVHGAFADASSWKGVVERLQKEGHTVQLATRPGRRYGVHRERRRPDRWAGSHLIMVSQPEAVIE
jgi:hypothetical protein